MADTKKANGGIYPGRRRLCREVDQGGRGGVKGRRGMFPGKRGRQEEYILPTIKKKAQKGTQHNSVEEKLSGCQHGGGQKGIEKQGGLITLGKGKRNR